MQTLFLLAQFFAISLSQGQSPVKWNFQAKKIDKQTFEVHLKASIENDWHIYAQKQPEGAISQPTTISFTPNPLVQLAGPIKEVGKLEKKEYELLGITQNEYNNTVDFVQTIKLKNDIKTNVKGSVSFMACKDGMCLPTETITFSIDLNSSIN